MTSSPSDSEMRAPQAAAYLRRIRLTTGQRALTALRKEIVNAYPKDSFTSRLVAIIKVRALRLQARN
jgi:hypothetical protein